MHRGLPGQPSAQPNECSPLDCWRTDGRGERGEPASSEVTRGRAKDTQIARYIDPRGYVYRDYLDGRGRLMRGCRGSGVETHDLHVVSQEVAVRIAPRGGQRKCG